MGNAGLTNHEQLFAIGLDVGGTKIAGGLVSLRDGSVIERQSIATRPERGGAAVFEDVLRLAELLCAHAADQNHEVVGIGVGVPELVDREGRITSGHTIDWRELPVQSRLEQLAPTVFEADVRAHALAEARYGAGRAFELFTFISVGTGISSCLVQGGVPFAGAHGNALVLATQPLVLPCTSCGNLTRFTLEEYASGPALAQRYNALAHTYIQSGRDVVAAAVAGDHYAIEVVSSAAAALGASVGWLVNVLDPQAVIMGGGLGMAGGLYWQRFEAATRAHIWAETGRTLPILMATLGADAGLIGAAAGVLPPVRSLGKSI